MLTFVSCCLVTKSCLTLCDPGTSGFPVLHHLPEFAPVRAHWISDAIQSPHPLLSLSPLALNHQGGESALCIRWPKYWSFSFSISPSNGYSGFISFRIDWFGLLAVQGTLRSLLRHNSKAAILWHSAFFMVQLSHPYLTTGQTMALTIWTFVRKVMSLLFSMLSKFFIAFLPRTKHLLISWLQSPSSVILEPKKIKKILLEKCTNISHNK